MLDYATLHRFYNLGSVVGLGIALISDNIELAIGMAEYITEKIENRYGPAFYLAIDEKYIDDMWKVYNINDDELKSYVSFVVGMDDMQKAKDCVEYLMRKRLLWTKNASFLGSICILLYRKDEFYVWYKWGIKKITGEASVFI